MKRHIRDFDSWQRVDESSFQEWLNTLVNKAKSLFADDLPDKTAAGNTKTSSGQDTSGSKPTGVKPGSTYFEYLDLRKDEDLVRYADACQRWIDSKKPFFNTDAYKKIEDPALKRGLEKYRQAHAPNSNDKLNGDAFAAIAKHYQTLKDANGKPIGKYLPWELAMAQATLEGGFSSTGKYPNGEITRPIITKNPFNVGNTDSGANVFCETIQDGIILYYDKMTKTYLNVRTADDLLDNFVNKDDNRYASGKEYEEGLKDLITNIKQKAA